MLFHVGDRQHTQYIQINKVIGENGTGVLVFLFSGGKKTKGLFGQPNRIL